MGREIGGSRHRPCRSGNHSSCLHIGASKIRCRFLNSLVFRTCCMVGKGRKVYACRFYQSWRKEFIPAVVGPRLGRSTLGA